MLSHSIPSSQTHHDDEDYLSSSGQNESGSAASGLHSHPGASGGSHWQSWLSWMVMMIMMGGDDDDGDGDDISDDYDNYFNHDSGPFI